MSVQRQNSVITDTWPVGGPRDTTEVPRLVVSAETRDHLKGFLQADGRPWKNEDQIAYNDGASVSGSRFRSYRKMYERMGVIYKDGEVVRISPLGKELASFEPRLAEASHAIRTSLMPRAASVLSRYQWDNPADGYSFERPEQRVHPCLCIWAAMLSLDNKLNNEELDRVICHITTDDEFPDAVRRIRDFRASGSSDYSTLGNHSVTDNQLSARMAALFSFAGWGDLLISEVADDGFRHVVPEAESILRHFVENPPGYFTAGSVEDWFRYYAGVSAPIPYPRNLIVFGAPGTGKSHLLENRRSICAFRSYERVTFHPDYTYASFVGSYKPVAAPDGRISYEFVPGPLIRVLQHALTNPSENHLLLIEEINRANAAAVFGDFFQCLDRAGDGRSTFPVHASEALREHLEKTTGLAAERLESVGLPANLYIWASMNPADQGVFPLDTAFKRRWSFEYIGINDEAADMLNLGDYPIKKAWNDYRVAINEALLSININEDKLLGPFFLPPSELISMQSFETAFEDKVLMYLFEDAARFHRKEVFSKEYKLFSQLRADFRNQKSGVFCQSIKAALEDGSGARTPSDGSAGPPS